MCVQNNVYRRAFEPFGSLKAVTHIYIHIHTYLYKHIHMHRRAFEPFGSLRTVALGAKEGRPGDEIVLGHEHKVSYGLRGFGWWLSVCPLPCLC